MIENIYNNHAHILTSYKTFLPSRTQDHVQTIHVMQFKGFCKLSTAINVVKGIWQRVP